MRKLGVVLLTLTGLAGAVVSAYGPSEWFPGGLVQRSGAFVLSVLMLFWAVIVAR